MERLLVIDSHTGGEPTRVVIDGLPDLLPKSALGKRELLQKKYDRYRTAVIGEPRSSEVAVGAYLLPSETADYGVVFFNNVGYLGMCGHGTIGLVATLAYLGRIEPGPVTFETPVGVVEARLHEDGSASFDNVPSYRYRKDQRIELGSLGEIVGDIAYGGNWFFISSVHGHEVDPSRIDALDVFASLVQDVIRIKGITGAND
nr:proline racemase family protein [Fimbriimonadaceae bacterium]